MSKSLPYRESKSTHSSPLLETSLPVTSDDDRPERIVVLSSQQELALEWLIGGGGIVEAAQYAGVARQTVSRWLREDHDFREVYHTWKEESLEILRGRMIAAGSVAMETVIEHTQEKHDLKAAQFVLKAILSRNGM